MAQKKLAQWHILDKKILQLLHQNPHGLRTATMLKLLNLPRRTLYNRLLKLQQRKFVKNIRPIWKPLGNPPFWHKLPSQLHDLSIHLRLKFTPSWWNKRTNKLIKLNEYTVKELQMKNNPYTQLADNNFIIHLHTNSITFYAQKKYTGTNALDCFAQATGDFYAAVRHLEKRLRFKIWHDNLQQVTINSSHANELQHGLAKTCKKHKIKGFEWYIDGRKRFWVDFSFPHGTEFGNKDYSLQDAMRAGKATEQIIQGASLPEEVDERIEGLTTLMESVIAVQRIFDKNMQSHVAAVQKLGNGVDELVKVVKELDNGKDRGI